jgi:DNA repair exonuclease SbcCD ATPase subunit
VVKSGPWSCSFALAVTICCANAWAPAQASTDEADLARTAIETFTRAADSLEQGDETAALQAVGTMSASVATLRGSAENYRELAEGMQRACEEHSLQIITQIQTTYQQEKETESKLKDIQSELEAKQAESAKLDNDLADLQTQMAPLIEEAHFRNQCAADSWFFFKTGRCWELSFQDAFDNRYKRVNSQILEKSQQRQTTWQLRDQLIHRRYALLEQAAQARNRVNELEALRRDLEKADEASRAAVSTLSDVYKFWSEAETQIRTQVSGGVKSLRRLITSLDTSSVSPDFTNYEVPQKARSLRDILVEFGRSLDSGKNFLAAGSMCK